jgi:hypothetical protein
MEGKILPVIDIMIAFYIVTRMVEIFEAKEKITIIFGVLTVLVALYAIYSLATSGANAPSSLTE